MTTAATLSWRGSAIHSVPPLAADAGAFVARLTASNVDHIRTLQEPLAILLLRSPISLAQRVWPSLPAIDAVRVELAVGAALWIAGVFASLRLLGCRRLDATLLAAIGLFSATMLIFNVPGVAPFASLFLLPALLVVFLAARGRRHSIAMVAAITSTAAMASVNIIVGAVAARVLAPSRRAAQWVTNALVALFVLVGVQQFIYPSSGMVVWPGAGADGESIMSAARVSALWPLADTASGIAPIGIATIAAWWLLVVLGMMAPASSVAPSVRVFLMASLGVQAFAAVALRVDGWQIAASSLPLLLMIAAMATMTAGRTIALVLAAFVAIGTASQHWTRPVHGGIAMTAPSPEVDDQR